MNSRDYWKMFLETGAPEYYLLYSRTMKMEETHVRVDPGGGIAVNRLQ